MSMHGSYDEYGQNDTADLVRSVALSSAKLWEEVFDRLRRLEDAQAELRAMLGRIESQLPAGPTNAALGSGAPSAPAWPDRAIAPAEPEIGDRETTQTDLFVPGPVDAGPMDEASARLHDVPMDAVDLLVGTPGPVAPEPVDEEPATFFFPPANEAAPLDSTAPEDATSGWPGSDLGAAPGWTSPHTVRYDEGFTSRDVVGPPTEEVQAIDVTPPERSNAEYFGRHAAGPPPGFAVAAGDTPLVGFEPAMPQVRVPETEKTFDPVIQQQLQQAAQAAESFATGSGPAEQPAPAFEAWGGAPDSGRVPLVYAPGDEPAGPVDQDVPPPPAGFVGTAEVPPPPVGFGTFGDDVSSLSAAGFGFGAEVPPPPPPGFTNGDVPPPPPGFGVGSDVPPPPPGFSAEGAGADVPPPPPGFGVGSDVPPPPPGFAGSGDVPPPPPGFAGSGDVPPPPPGFAGSGDVPPPPPGFAGSGDVPPAPPGFSAGGAVPPPPLGFGSFGDAAPVHSPDDLPPAAPPGFATAGLANFGASSPPPPPPGFAANGGSMVADPPPPPPVGFVASPAGPAGAPLAPPPPPPGFTPGGNGSPPAQMRIANVSDSIADDLLAMNSMAPVEPAGNGAEAAGKGNGNGHGHSPEDDGPPPPITPDFFARAGRRRR